MKKIGDGIGRLRAFLREVNVELRKCAWPSRPELVESTVVVIISMLLTSAYVGLSDTILRLALNALVR